MPSDSRKANKKQLTRSKSFKFGFTLIELLIVVTLFGITASLVTASYATFERNQRVKDAAKNFKSEIRFTQNKALSGDKSSCVGTTELIGWYIYLAKNATSYFIRDDCFTVTEGYRSSYEISLPKNIKIINISYGSLSDISEANILFRPLLNTVSFHSGSNTPGFVDDSSTDVLENLLNDGTPEAKDTLIIRLEHENVSSASKYEVEITSSGEVNEKKI